MTTSACPACGANAFVAGGDGGTCEQCGYASGESSRCPHCKAMARIEGSGKRAVCAVCGGPRIPSNLGGEAASAALRQQKKALANARLASAATVFQGLAAVLVTLVGLAVAPAALVGKLIVFALAAAPLFLALRSRSRATRARALAEEASDRAWHAAAEDAAARAKQGVTVDALAKMLGVEPAEADRLLTDLTVHDRARIDVGDDAEVRYSALADPRVAEEDSPLESEESDDRKGRAP